jgi:hypothetical protein
MEGETAPNSTLCLQAMPRFSTIQPIRPGRSSQKHFRSKPWRKEKKRKEKRETTMEIEWVGWVFA